jgi:RimJ/RimL family protein N-acetyltransferase
MDVVRYSESPVDDLSPLFAGRPHGRYGEDWTLDAEAVRTFESERLTAYLQANGDTSLLCVEDGLVRGAIGLRHSAWDTDFWGFPCAAVEHLIAAPTDPDGDARRVVARLAAAADEWCREEGIRFAYARCDANNLSAIAALEELGFRYIETTVTNTYDLRSLPPAESSAWTIREVRPDEADLLAGLAQDAFLTHRFYADEAFSAERADAMYERWVRDSVADPHWTTIVLEESGRVNGFFTYRLEDLRAHFGLRFAKWRMAAVDSAARGRGHGRRLFLGAMEHVRDDADVVDSGLSVRNTRSFNLHNRLGFRVVSFSTTLHRWY